LLAVALLLSVAPSTPAQTGNFYELYVIDSFPTPTSLKEAYALDVNDLNQAVGYTTSGSYYDGYVWDVLTGKTMLPASSVSAINNVGNVVLSDGVYDLNTSGFTQIPPVNSSWPLVFPVNLNDAGVVVGYGRNFMSDSDGINRVPLIWDRVNGTRGINVPGSKELREVNSSNLAVGVIRRSASAERALVYDIDTGAWTNLSTLLPPDPWGGEPWSDAFALNDLGVVAGEGYDGVSLSAFTWSQPQGFTFLPGFKGGDTMRVHPRGINDAGHLVGYALDANWDWGAFLWDPVAGMRDLNDLTVAPAGFKLVWGRQINDNGWIVGDGFYGNWGPPFYGWVLRPRAELEMWADPQNPSSGQTLTLGSAPGQPGTRAMLALVAVDGSPLILRIALGQYDATGTWNFTVTVPQGLSGMSLTFQSFGEASTGRFLATAPVTVTFP
jgi:probable HAF family extracellular repeat protein